MTTSIPVAEIGDVLPREERELSVVGVLAAAVLVLIAAAIVLVTGIDSLFGFDQRLAFFVKIAVASLLVLLAGVLLVRSVPWIALRESATGRDSQLIDSIDLLNVDTADVDRISSHFTGEDDRCDEPRGIPPGEIVVATITEHNAGSIAEIPEKCTEYRRESGLFPILMGVPRADRSVIETASDPYEFTVLVNESKTERLQEFLNLVPQLCESPRVTELAGVGSVSVNCIVIDGHSPTDPHLLSEVAEGRGEPLAEEAKYTYRSDEETPDLTVLATPEEYLSSAVDSLPKIDEPVVPVKSGSSSKIQVTRLFLNGTLATDENVWNVRRAPRRETSE